jgi:hypothetical protein
MKPEAWVAGPVKINPNVWLQSLNLFKNIDHLVRCSAQAFRNGIKIFIDELFRINNAHKVKQDKSILSLSQCAQNQRCFAEPPGSIEQYIQPGINIREKLIDFLLPIAKMHIADYPSVIKGSFADRHHCTTLCKRFIYTLKYNTWWYKKQATLTDPSSSHF